MLDVLPWVALSINQLYWCSVATRPLSSSKLPAKILLVLNVQWLKSPSWFRTMTEVTKLVPQLMDHGLVSCRFVSNQNERKFFPDLPIEANTIKMLAKTVGLHIIFEYFALNEKPQEHLNTTCNARLTFADCTFNGRGALLLSKPDIPLHIAFRGQHDSCFPDLVHLATALEHGFLEDLSMEMLMEPYKLKGPQDCNDLKRFCSAAVRLGHKVAWGDKSRTRFGNFFEMPDHESETINMGLFDLNNLGSAGTRHVVSSFFDEAEAEFGFAASPRTVKEPFIAIAEEEAISVTKHGREEVAPATAPPAIKELSIEEEDVSNNAENAENKPGVNPNVELAEADGVCHGIMKNGSGDCQKKPMIGKRMCWSHRAQDGQA